MWECVRVCVSVCVCVCKIKSGRSVAEREWLGSKRNKFAEKNVCMCICACVRERERERITKQD